MFYIFYNNTTPIPPEGSQRDWTDCEMWGCLPPDSMGVCSDCGDVVPRERPEKINQKQPRFDLDD